MFYLYWCTTQEDIDITGYAAPVPGAYHERRGGILNLSIVLKVKVLHYFLQLVGLLVA